MTIIMSLKENVERILSQIELIRAGRKYFSDRPVVLVAATKYVGAEVVNQLIDWGIRDIGENRVQDAEKKFSRMGERISRVKKHFIGHLQTNKVRKCLQLFDMIDSLDNEKLARVIDEEARRLNRIVPCLVEVKVSPEATKFGQEPEELLNFWARVRDLKNIQLRGLMTMAPFMENPEDCRPFFRQARQCLEKIVAEFGLDWPELSMGMSNDYPIAIEEGATMVRIGSALYQGVI